MLGCTSTSVVSCVFRVFSVAVVFFAALQRRRPRPKESESRADSDRPRNNNKNRFSQPIGAAAGAGDRPRGN